jgi:hypothetical protein
MQPRVTLSSLSSSVSDTASRCRSLIASTITTLESQRESDAIFKKSNNNYETSVTVEQQQTEMRRQIEHYQHLLDNAKAR